MPDNRFATLWTNELVYLISCVRTGSYGESDGAFHARKYDNIGALRNFQIGDRVFLRFKDKLICGPLIVSEPPDHFSIDESRGCWHRVNAVTTPKEYHATWLIDKPWCVFFDAMLASQVNYCLFTYLPKHLRKLPPSDFISDELGQELWTYMEDFGTAFSEFLDRQEKLLRIERPVPQFKPSSTTASRRFDPQALYTGRYRTKNGVVVKSKSEMIISNYLHDHGFRFEYSKLLVLDGKQRYPDFHLPDHNLYIEHLGLLDNDDYRRDWENKSRLYDQNKVNYIFLTEVDIQNIEVSLTTKLSQKGCKPPIP